MSINRSVVHASAAFGALLATAICASQPPHPPRDFDKMQLVEISNGPNSIDIDGDGKDDEVFQAHRENYNAHSFERVTFYRREAGGESPSMDSDKLVWSVVPFFAADHAEKDSLETVQGADCRLRDWIVLRRRGDKRAPVTVIVADRDFGDTYVDKKHVTFSVYRLTRNNDESIGFPAVYFSQVDQFRSRQTYCDADMAIRQELGVKLKSSPDSDGIDG